MAMCQAALDAWSDSLWLSVHERLGHCSVLLSDPDAVVQAVYILDECMALWGELISQ